MLKIRRTKDLPLISRLDEGAFPEEPMSSYTLRTSTWWVAILDGVPVGYAGARVCDEGEAVFLSRAGVLKEARGKGIQRRLIRARVLWARKQKADCVITYTSISNCPSSNNLAAFGFQLWRPEWKWVGAEYLYWKFKL